MDLPFIVKLANSEQIEKILHVIIDNLVRNSINKNLEEFVNKEDWSLEDLKKLESYIQKFYIKKLTEDCDILPEDIPNNVRQAIMTCFEVRKTSIFKFLARQALLKDGQKLVENIDWKLKYVMGSSKLITIREPLLQIDFHCAQKTDRHEEQNSVISFEANLDQVDFLITELSRIKEELETK